MSFLSKENEHQHIQILFTEHYARLLHFCCQLVGDKSCAEDIVQDTFIKYWGRISSVSEEKVSIKAFLYQTVRNASLNIIRHRKVADEHLRLQDSEPVEEAVIHAIVRSEVLSELYRAIESLPLSCRQISRLGYLDGKKNQEIAEELGISINTVKTQKQRAIKLLRLRLTPELMGLLLLFGHL